MAIESIGCCDHPQCPARAQHTVMIYGADFHFCAHHADELAPQLAGVPADAPTTRATGDQVSPPSQGQTSASSETARRGGRLWSTRR